MSIETIFLVLRPGHLVTKLNWTATSETDGGLQVFPLSAKNDSSFWSTAKILEVYGSLRIFSLRHNHEITLRDSISVVPFNSLYG